MFLELPVEYFAEIGVVSGLGSPLGGPVVGFYPPYIDQGTSTRGIAGAGAASPVPDLQVAWVQG